MSAAVKYATTDGGIQVPEKDLRLYANKWWRINNLYYILNQHGREVLFRCNQSQARFYSELWYQNIVLKSRQQGFTTFIDIYILDDAIWTDNLECGIIAHNKDDAQKIFRRKVQYPYRHMPTWIQEQRPLVTDSRQELAFNNNSIIYVATSLRSGTVQRLHVSEHGKICRKYPDKADELRSGTLNAVHPGSLVFIESTAEGRFGDFYDWCQLAQNQAREDRPLTMLDRKFHFFPWWIDAKCVLSAKDAQHVVITKEDREYFERIEVEINSRPELFGLLPAGTKPPFRFSTLQRAWYVKKYETQQEKMLQEYPSTPEEAFDASIKGAYFAKQMVRMRQEKRICTVPYDPDLPVDISWDLGMDDSMFLVCRQRFQWENRIINCYQNHDESFQHYVKWIEEQGYVLGTMYLPHDAAKRTLREQSKDTRKTTLERLMPGVKMIIVPRCNNLMDKIHATRTFLSSCWIDAENCQDLIACLDNYRQAWDDKLGQWKGEPVKDWATHGASSIGEFAYAEDPDHGNLTGKGRGWRRRRTPGGRGR